MRFVKTKFNDLVMVLDDSIYPCTIVSDRYGGTYSGAAWLAFPCDATMLPEGYDDGDVETAEFFADHVDSPIGKGRTPTDALKHLMELLK